MWLDAIFYKICDNGKIKTSAVYSVLGINLEGRKDILGLYIYKSENSSFWAQVLKDLSNRGVNNILIACIDGLKGFPEVIKSIFPKTKIQLCIIHQIRNSLKQIDKKDKTKFRKDLKKIYIASTEQIANISLDNLISKWRETYPIVIKSWENNWNNLNGYFKYSKKIRKIIYTTNAIESVHRQFRKLTKSKSVFPNKNSLLKLLYLGIKNIKNKWSMPINNWNSVVNELKIQN